MIGLIKGTARQLKTVSGLPLPIASYKSNSKLPIQELSLSINPTQSGSGDPAPDNIRPITGVSSVNVANISDDTKVQYFKGLFNGTYGFVDLGDLSWLKDTTVVSGKTIFRSSLSAKSQFNAICSNYNFVGAYTNLTDKTCCYIYNTWIGIEDSTYNESTAEQFKTAMSGVYLIYELATPITPTITPTQFNTLLTAFGISGYDVVINLGDTYYGATLDVTSGKLRVDRKYITADNLTWNYSDGFVYSAMSDTDDSQTTEYPTGKRPIVCNIAAYLSSGAFVTNRVTWGGYINNKNLCIKNSYTDSLANWETYISNNTVQFVYYIMPIEIDLTPTQVNSLLGSNNIWHDGNGNVEVLKFMDRQLYFGR